MFETLPLPAESAIFWAVEWKEPILYKLKYKNLYKLYWWWHGVVVNALVVINEVTLVT